METLKELSVKLGGQIKSQAHYNVNFDETSARKLVVKDYRQYEIRIDEYKDLYSLGISVNSDLSFSINKPDLIFLYKIPKSFPGLSYKVYVSDEMYTFIKNEYVNIFWSSLVALLNEISLSEFEGIYFYKNLILFSLKKERDILLILDRVIDLINANRKIFKRRQPKKVILSEKVPDNLKPLIPLLKKYAVSDDADREILKEEMTRNKKIKLIKIVRPYFDEITIYLDSFKNNPLTEEATLVGKLAELVSELEIEDL